MSGFLEVGQRKIKPIFKGGGGSGEEEPVKSFQLQCMGSYWNNQPIFQHPGDNELLRNNQHGFVKNKLTTNQSDFPFFDKMTGPADER